MTIRPTRYATYLTLTQVDQRFEAVGYSDYRVSTGWSSTDSTYWGKFEAEQLAAGEMPSLWEYGDVQVYPEDWTLTDPERVEARQGLVDELLRRYPDIQIGTDATSGASFLHWKHGPCAVTVNLGNL